MTKLEAESFVESILKGFYPRWNPKDEEFRGWVSRLVYYEYDSAKRAVDMFFFDCQTRTIEPPAGKIMRAISRSARIIVREFPTVMTSIEIECIEAPERNPNLEGAKRGVFAEDTQKQNDPDYVLGCAELMKIKYEELYGGKWIIVHKPEPEPDSGLRGKQAFDKAAADILNGPDSKTRRWLEKHLQNTFNFEKNKVLKTVPSLVKPKQGMAAKKQMHELYEAEG